MPKAACRRLAVAMLTAVAIAPGAAVGQQADTGTEDVMIVLDASNSMWGQIDGVSKIEIAREVVGELVRDWDPQRNLGLVAYGHRREGDCTDIETVLPVGPVDADAFTAAVDGLLPRGKTPLTEAVRQAAEDLSFADRPATVILVSDGIETCNADPCALAEDLERRGVAFTAHVVGFDVATAEEQAQLQCIADNTGGLFLAAADAEELTSALETVAKPEPPPQPEPAGPAMVTLEAVEGSAEGPVIETGVSWSIFDPETERTVAVPEGEARPTVPVKPGSWTARAERAGETAIAGFAVGADESRTVQVVLPVSLPDASVSVDPQSPTIGQQVAVAWEGPDGDGDYVTVVEPGAEEGTHGDYAYTRNGNPADIVVPDVAGFWEVRYVRGSDGATLGATEIEVRDVPVTLDAPDEAAMGATVDVAWEGPDAAGDYVTVVEAGADDGTYLDYAYTRNGNPAEVRMPETGGAFELRYVSGQSQRTMASRPIDVRAVQARLDAPAEASAGSEVSVAWKGPDNDGDYVTVVEAGAPEGQYGDYTYTRDGSPLPITMPDASGAYELRYVTGAEGRTLASSPITVTAVSAALEAPSAVDAGGAFRVDWTGPDNDGDYVTIVEAGAPEGRYRDYVYTRDGSPVEITAPDEPGDYEVRYVTGQSGATLASAPIAVDAVTATLDAPASANAGATIEVAWTGPDNDGDYVTVVEAGAAEGRYRDYSYTRNGSPAEITVPDDPGAYEVRYVTGGSGATLASAPLTIEAVAATVSPPSAVKAGQPFPVEWQGPDNDGDYVTIVEAGAPEGRYRDYAYTRNGSPAEITAPEEAGSYEVRYVTGGQGRTLASVPVEVR